VHPGGNLPGHLQFERHEGDPSVDAESSYSIRSALNATFLATFSLKHIREALVWMQDQVKLLKKPECKLQPEIEITIVKL